MSILEDNKWLLTIEPDFESKKAIKIILGYLKPNKDKQVYIGQVYFTNEPEINYEGISIYCAYGIVGILHEGEYYWCKAEAGTNYKKVFKQIDPNFKAKLNKASYKIIAKKVTKSGRDRADSLLKSELNSMNSQVESYRQAIKKESKGYADALKASKKYKEIAKTLPEEVIMLLSEGKKKIDNQIKNVKSYADACNVGIKRKIEIEKTQNYIQSQEVDIGGDLKALKNLEKKGFIESIKYNKGEGLSWVYPPMIYKTGYKAGEGPTEVFLGRVSVTLAETTPTFRIRPISYKKNSQYLGTWHFDYQSDGINYCLGQFDTILYNLLAMGQIAQLVVVMKDYILSVNQQSRKHVPVFSSMSMSKPEVVDDSFEVWKKSSEGIKYFESNKTKKEEVIF